MIDRKSTRIKIEEVEAQIGRARLLELIGQVLKELEGAPKKQEKIDAEFGEGFAIQIINHLNRKQLARLVSLFWTAPEFTNPALAVHARGAQEVRRELARHLHDITGLIVKTGVTVGRADIAIAWERTCTRTPGVRGLARPFVLKGSTRLKIESNHVAQWEENWPGYDDVLRGLLLDSASDNRAGGAIVCELGAVTIGGVRVPIRGGATTSQAAKVPQ